MTIPTFRPPLQSLKFAAIVLPTLLFLLAGFSLWRVEVERAEHRVLLLSETLREHLLKVLETHELFLDRAVVQLSDLDWDNIQATAATHEAFAAIPRRHSGDSAIHAVDETGRWRVSSLRYPLPEGSAAEREYFTALKAGHKGTFISEAFAGGLTGDQFMAMARRLERPDGAFAGTIHAALKVAHLEEIWRKLADGPGDAVSLVRMDGLLLARMPSLAVGQHHWSTPVEAVARQNMRGVAWGPSPVDRQERVYGYSTVGPYPLRVIVSTDQWTILLNWARDIVWIVPFWILTTAAVVGALAHAAVRWQREHEALQQERAAQKRWQGAVATLKREIEARQEAEAALRHAQKVEAIGRLTGGVAHDLNNVLQAISSSLSSLDGTARGEQRRQIEVAATAVARGSWLTQHLTAFARKQALIPEVVSPHERLPPLRDLLERTMGGQAKIEVDVQPDAWAVKVDPTQLELAIINLAMNARDAMPAGGSILLAASNVAAGEIVLTVDGPLPEGEYLCLAMTDTGEGMSPAVIAQAVEPFFTTKEIGKGTGLGLSMVHGFAAQSGGGLAIESAPGRGTTVRLYLPRTLTSAPEVPPVAPSSVPPPVQMRQDRKTRILLVDDDALVRAGMAGVLAQAGYEVVEAASGAQALDLYHASNFDILLTDFAMPEMSGLQLLESIGDRTSGCATLLLTGYSGPEQPRDLERLADAVLTKPVAPQRLLMVLRGLEEKVRCSMEC